LTSARIRICLFHDACSTAPLSTLTITQPNSIQLTPINLRYFIIVYLSNHQISSNNPNPGEPPSPIIGPRPCHPPSSPRKNNFTTRKPSQLNPLPPLSCTTITHNSTLSRYRLSTFHIPPLHGSRPSSPALIAPRSARDCAERWVR
jgi:hypothetical protein